MDDTLYDFVKPLLVLHNAKYNMNVQESEITDYKIDNFLSPLCRSLFNDFVDEVFFKKIKISGKNIDSVNILHENNEIYFVSAGHPKTAESRNQLLKRTFSWYSQDNLILTKNKQMLNLDYLIDDCPYHINKNTYYKSILKKKPWNKKYNYDGLVRVIDIGFFAFKLKYGMV